MATSLIYIDNAQSVAGAVVAAGHWIWAGINDMKKRSLVMNVHELEGSSVLSITVDQAHRYFEMVARLDDGSRNKLMAWNADGAKLTIRLGALNVQNSCELGELEGISIANNVISLEGDFGDITITATSILIEKLT